MTSKIQSVLIPKEKSKLHAVNFPKTGFTLKQSHKWLLDHDFKLPKKVDETINFYRYRQKLPDKRYTYTTKVLSNGVELVLMWKKPFIKIGGVKRQVYTPEPDSNITQTALNNAIATLKPWRVFQLKELIQKYSESKNLNIKYKVSKRIKLIETILKFNINPNEYEISQINPKQPVPANVLKKYGLKPNNDDEQRRYEEELRNELEKDGKMTKSPLLAKAEYITKEGLLEKVVLQEHQEKFIKQFIFSNLRGAIVFHGVGTGKTLTAVVASYFYLIMYPTHKVVVISPSALLYNFINGMRQFGINPTDNRYKYLTYEKYINSQRSKNPIKTKDSLLIIDEAHNFRTEIIKVEIRDPETDEVIGYDSIKNKRGQTILSRGAIYAHKVLLLTGTPFVNTIYDIENLLAMVEKRDPLTKLQFFNMLTIPENIPDYFNYKISYQPVIDSSFFPRMIPHIEGIYMTDQQESLYNQIKNIGKFELGDEGEIVPLNDTDKPNSYFSAERYATNAIDKENNPKINRILELVKEKPTQKFIIYTALQDAGIKLLEKKLTSNQISFKVISGSESTSQKEESRRYFNGFYSSEIPKSNDAGMLSYTNDKYRVLLITKAGTEGVDTVNCHNLILLDHQWNDASTEQIIARAIRFKSHHALPVSERYVNVYTLLFVFKKEEPYITRLNEPGFNDYIGLKNDVSEPSNQSKDIQNKIKNATKSINNIKLRLEEDKLNGKSEKEIKKLVISEFTKLINRSIESMPEIKKELEEMKIYIDKQFEELQKKQKYTGMIEVGHKSSRQGIGKKWSADTRKEITYSNYVSNYLVSYIIEGFKNLIDKKVDFGELDTLNVSIDLKLFLLSKSKQKNINEFVSKIGNEITIFEKYETKLLPLIMKKELELKRELTDAEQIDIYREFLLKEDQNALKNKFVPSLETIGKNKRMTQDVKQQFFTQLELAKEIANLGLDGLKGQIEILEPTAGSGGLIQPLIQNLITNKDIIFKVDMIEIDNKNRIILKELEKASPNILNLLDNKNFLTIVRKQYYDIILMNPPFHLNGKENGLLKDTYDWEFMRRAFSFLKVGGSLVCISSIGWSFGIQYKRFMAEFPILQKSIDDNNYGQRLKEGYDITGDTKYCDYEIYRKTSKFKGSEGKDTSNEMPIDVFKLTKLSNELDNDILNTVFYRKVEKEAEELENNNIDLDNDIKPPPPPKPSPPPEPEPEPEPQKEPEVILPEPIKAPENSFKIFSDRLNMLVSMGPEKLGYVPSELITTFSYAYLMEKYKSSCPIFRTYKKVNVEDSYSFNTPKAPKTGIDYKDRKIQAPEDFGKYLKSCIDRGEDLIVFPLMLPTHANLLVYRPYQKIIERYEPHGSEYGGTKTSDEYLNKVLKKYFEEELKDDLKQYTPRFKTPLQICPIGFIRGLQSIEGTSKLKKKIEGAGYCQIWSLFLLETILLNPKLSTQQIIKDVLDISKLEPDYLLNLIRGYVSLLSNNFKELINKLGAEFKNLSIRNKTIYNGLTTTKQKDIFNDYLIKLVDESLTKVKQKPDFIPEEFIERSDEKLKKELLKEVNNIKDDETEYLYYYLIKNKIKPQKVGYSASSDKLRKDIVKILLEKNISLEEFSKKNIWKPAQGGAINKKELKSFVEAGYKKKKDVQNIDGYILDKELSTKRDKIYYDPKTKKSVHVIAGTDNLKDWSNNLLIPFGLHHLSNRYKNSEEAQKKANAKYGKNNVSVVSHSQSGNIADNLAKRDLVGDENITLNPAIIGSPNKKVKVVKSFFDPVSYFTKTKKGDEVLMPSSLNPLKEHSPQILEGKGRFKKK